MAMERRDTTAIASEDPKDRGSTADGDGGKRRKSSGGGPPDGDSGSGPHGPHGAGGSAAGRGRAGSPSPGYFDQYKPEQGQWTRRSTFIVSGLLIAWGSWSLYDQLRVYEGENWQLLITPGIPILFAVVLTALVWRISFVSRKTGDFMIATEGEMKKVSWSSKREVTGSTKVVILFTVLLAALLFTVDLVFQALFRWIGVLKT